MKTITDKTAIPLGVAVLAIGGGAWFIAHLDSRVEAGTRIANEANAAAAAIAKGQQDMLLELREIKFQLKLMNGQETVTRRPLRPSTPALIGGS